MHIGDGVAFAFALRQRFEAAMSKPVSISDLDQMHGKRRNAPDSRAGLCPRRSPAGSARTIPESAAVVLVLLVAVADGVAVIDREGRAAVLLVALVLIVAHHDQRIELGVAQASAQMRLMASRATFWRATRCSGATMWASLGSAFSSSSP